MCAGHIARDLSAMGKDVVLASPEPMSELQALDEMIGSDHILTDALILDLNGAVGNFSVRLAVGGKDVNLQPGIIVMAVICDLQPRRGSARHAEAWLPSAGSALLRAANHRPR